MDEEKKRVVFVDDEGPRAVGLLDSIMTRPDDPTVFEYKLRDDRPTRAQRAMMNLQAMGLAVGVDMLGAMDEFFKPKKRYEERRVDPDCPICKGEGSVEVRTRVSGRVKHRPCECVRRCEHAKR